MDKYQLIASEALKKYYCGFPYREGFVGIENDSYLSVSKILDVWKHKDFSSATPGLLTIAWVKVKGGLHNIFGWNCYEGNTVSESTVRSFFQEHLDNGSYWVLRYIDSGNEDTSSNIPYYMNTTGLKNAYKRVTKKSNKLEIILDTMRKHGQDWYSHLEEK